MSILETPRILFRGNMSWDPIVTNNKPSFYDEAQGEAELPGGAVMHPAASSYRDRVLAYRKAAIDGNFWDVHGTHRSSFYDLAYPDESCPASLIVASEVSGVELGDGLTQDDPFVGVPVQFTGMLVDVEPYGTTSSQLFFDTMTFGIPGGCRIVARRRTRATARYVNFRRNQVGALAGVGSVAWQTSFLRSDLDIFKFDSAALDSLEKALEGKDVLGLTVRWYTYRTIYFDQPVETTANLAPFQAALVRKLTLKDPYGNGVFQPNPARSKMVGTLGLWRKGEPLHEPGDRVLIPPPTGQTIASAFARLEGDRLSFDFGNSFPETGLDLTKENFGDLNVYALLPSQDKQKIATIAADEYAQHAYETGSGVIVKRVDQSKFPPSAALQIGNGDKIYLQEAPIRIVPDVPNVYANEGEAASISFQVYVDGSPAGGAVESFEIAQLDADFNKLGTFPVTPSPDGAVRLDVSTATPGVFLYVPLLPGQPLFAADPGTFAQHHTYVNFRCLPADKWVGELPPTWDNVYCYVLANWNALAPCMDNWLDLHDPDQVRAYGPLLERLTDPAHFEDFRYMPVTRDMTVGERNLLCAFLDPSAGEQAVDAAAAATEAPTKGREGETILSLSRAMRVPDIASAKADTGSDPEAS